MTAAPETPPLYGRRRLTFCMVVISIATLALFAKRLPAEQFADVLQWLIAAYLASDGVEKLAKRPKGAA